MNVDQAYSIMKYALAKNISQGYFSPVDFGIAFNSAQKSYTAYLLGNFQTYNPGRPISKTELGQNAVVRQRLSPVIYGYILNVDTIYLSLYYTKRCFNTLYFICTSSYHFVYYFLELYSCL